MKKIISVLLAMIIFTGMISVPAVYAETPGVDTEIYCYGGFGSPGALEYQHLSTGEWEDISCPYWRTRDSYSISYCLESDMESPLGESYRRVSFNSVYSASTLNGIRAIILHGYPNDNGGLSEDEAHYATQLAIWSWMYESASVGYSLYNPSRIRAGAGYNGVYNMYQNLLNYARNNNQNIGAFGISASPSTVILNNVGGQLKGTATVSFNNLNGYYTIDQSKLPSGVTITPTTGYNGQTITITSTSNFNGQTMNLTNALVGHDSRNPANIFWYEPDNTDYQNMVTVDLNFLPVAYGSLSFRVNTGNLSIIKTTQHNNGSVSGFTFEVRNSAGTLIGTYTTDSSGKIDILNLTPGTYSVKEINLSSDFVEPTPNPKSVTVNAGQTASVSFDNIKKRGVISVRKTDANFTLGGYSLAEAEFQILDQGGTVVDTITTGSDGRAQSKILPLGVYRVKETKAPYGFLLDTNIYTVPLSGTLGNADVVYSPDTSVAETPVTGRINLEKSNKDPMMGDYNLSGARYEVRAAEDIKRIDGSYYARTGDLVDTMITGADGVAQSKDLHLGKYTVKEVNAPYGYLLDTAAYDVTLSYGGQTVPIVYASVNSGETPEPGRIRVHKYNQSPNMGDYELAGARFEVRADEDLYTRSGALIHAKGQLVDAVITDTNGNGESKDLPLGKYTVKEVTAPWGYTVNTNTYPAVLSYGGQTVLISYTDTTNPQRPQTGKITLEKYDLSTDKRPQGDATLKGMVVEIYAAETLRDRQGNLIHSKDELLETLHCGDNVSVTSKEFPLGNYYWKEKVPPTGYTLDPTPHPFSIEYSNQNITVNLLNRIQKNKVIEGKIALVKHTDQPDPDVQPPNPQVEQPLEGAIFQVYLKKAGSYDAALPTERALLATNENGYCESGLLDRADWEKAQQRRKRAYRRVQHNGERNMFSGILKCADCGGAMGYHFNQKNREIEYFNCSNNNRSHNKTCDTTHYVRVDFLEQAVLGEIRRLTRFASQHENEFVKVVMGHSQQNANDKRQAKQRELNALISRDKELDSIFERLYEDNIVGKITDERFSKMSQKYEKEQLGLAAQIKELKDEVAMMGDKAMTIDMFISTVRQYTRARKLTPRMLNELVDFIEVFNAEKIDEIWEQDLRIHFNCVGAIEIPEVLALPRPDVTIKTRRGVSVSYAPAKVAI